jgi:hypothetical protein
MIVASLTMKDNILKFVQKNKLNYLQARPEKWLILEQLASLLKMFNSMVNNISATAPLLYATLGQCYILNDFLKDFIEHRKDKYKNLSIDIINAFQAAIDKYEKY